MPTGPKGHKAPQRIKQKLGKGKLDKGRWDKLYIWAWDFAEPCTYEECELFDTCTYVHSRSMIKKMDGPMSSTKCLMQQRYLRTVLHAIVETLQRKKLVSTEQMIRMGYQMIPLYAQLFKFKKLEFGNAELTYVSDKGAMKINPVYKEIREIIKTIEGIWNKITTTLKDKKPAGEIGDGGYQAAMSEAMGEDTVVLEDNHENIQSVDFNVDEGCGIDLENISELNDPMASVFEDEEHQKTEKPKKKKHIIRRKKK